MAGGAELVITAALLLAISLRAEEPSSLYRVNYETAAVPASPDVSKKSPGPGGGPDRAGYTTADLRHNVGIAWSDAGRRGEKVLVYAQAVDVDVSLDISVAVSSLLDRQGCPYDETWKHELTHARAFQSIYAAARKDFIADLGRLKPRVPTKDDPEPVDASHVEAYQASVSRAVRRAVEKRAELVLKAMDKDRRQKDSPDAYAAVYDGCAMAEWGFRR